MRTIEIKEIYKIVNEISFSQDELATLPTNSKLRLLPLIKSPAIDKFELAKINISINKKIEIIEELIDDLEKSGIKVTILKGASLVSNYTGYGISRNFGDIDLLVHKDVKHKLESILFTNFEKEKPGKRPFSDTYETTWNHKKFKNIQLDVHTTIYYEAIYKPKEFWFTNTEKHSHFNSNSIQVLQPELLISHLIIHSIKDERLYGYELIDICNILKKRKIDETKLDELVDVLGIYKISKHILEICRNIINKKNPQDYQLIRIPNNKLLKKIYFIHLATSYKLNTITLIALYIYRLLFRKRGK